MQESLIDICGLSTKGRGEDAEKKFEIVGALPDEKVLIEIGPKRRRKRLRYVQEVACPSPFRIPARCSHFPLCGGCAFQQWEYSAQLQHKENLVKKQFSTLPGLSSEIFQPILGCEDPWFYRNKMEYTFSQNRAGEKFLGLNQVGVMGRVVSLKECFLGSEWFVQTVHATRQWWEKSSLSAYHFRTDEGHLRRITLREARQGKGKMIMLTVSGNPEYALKKSEINSFVEEVKKTTADENLSIFLQIHQIAKGNPTQFYEMLLSGPDHITEQLNITIGEKTYPMLGKISATSFFQPNTKGAEIIYSKGLQMLENLKGAKVLDLYCGGGLIGLSAAHLASKVIGIESNPHAVFDAQWNQEVNGISNFDVYRGDVATVLQKQVFDPDIVIVDPPRSGLDPEAIKQLIQLKPKEILYISCNPLTQVENIAALLPIGYQVKKVQPVDQFPHTPHVENIVLLQKC